MAEPAAREFTCPSCSLPQSQLPADHEVELMGMASVCSGGVRPVPVEGYALGGGGSG